MKLFKFLKKDKIHRSFSDNAINICQEDLEQVKCHINGKNNTINIERLGATCKGSIELYVNGDNNEILIEKNLFIGSKLIITIGRIHKNFGPISNTKVTIGKNSSIGSCTIITYNSNSKISIGENCMFAFNTFLFNTDAHPIINKETNQIINKVKNMKIGNHVWIGANVNILKNSIIPDDSIIGLGSVVSGDYSQKGSGKWGYIIAGNPAKIIRDNITWNENGSGEYVQNSLTDAISGGVTFLRSGYNDYISHYKVAA